jgi:predicted PurR-regulated permease PerM
MDKRQINRSVVLLLALAISALFLSMIRQFLMAILLAAIFSALFRRPYRCFEKWFGGRRGLASVTTLALLVFIVLLPLAGLFGIITAQAIKVGEAAKPWVQHQISQADSFSAALKSLPFAETIAPYRDDILIKAGQLVGSISSFLVDRLSSFTLGTIHLVFMTFVMLYTMFFFLVDGEKLLHKILYYLPLKDDDEQRMLEKFTSVTRSTLKGTAVIGILQGTLAGLAFAVVGIPSAVFWGTIMTVLSVIPGIGSALVWVPAAVVLATTGNMAKAVGLTAFCVVVVGSLDNFLRPRLVGKDTKLHELMIFFGTIGGIMMFGVVGFIIGPIVAALFITIWDMYGLAFDDLLPATGRAQSHGDMADAKGLDADGSDDQK